MLSGVLFSGIQANLDAFSEDICLNLTDPNPMELRNCWDKECLDDGGIHFDGKDCSTAGSVRYLKATLLGKQYEDWNRSVVHFDLVWILARLNGLNPQDSLTLAAYSQAPDKGRYVHYSSDGKKTLLYKIDDLGGVYPRGRLSTAGAWFHFVPRTGGTRSSDRIDFMRYDFSNDPPFDDSEGPIIHLRDWAMGKRQSVCRFGITDKTGNCPSEGKLMVWYPAIWFFKFPYFYSLGHQPIVIRSEPSQSEKWTAENAGTLKALGVYLHALTDRLSHTLSTEGSFIRPGGWFSRFQLTYLWDGFEPRSHGREHYPEIGHGNPPQRTSLAISYTHDEIVRFLKLHPDLVKEKKRYDFNKLKIELMNALGTGSARARVGALCMIARAYGLGWHDANNSCSYGIFYD